MSSATVGDYITFGTYEQDNNASNGKEDIEWLVLRRKGNNILIISKYALDCKPYNEEYTESITWEECTLRTWLNNDYIDSAFNAIEKTKIPTVTVVYNDNARYGTDGGDDTQDKIFLLSIDEVKKYFYLNEEIKCGATEYAEAQEVDVSSEYIADGKAACYWWLHSPGDNQGCVAQVRYDGYVKEDGIGATSSEIAVRPAMWISIE